MKIIQLRQTLIFYSRIVGRVEGLPNLPLPLSGFVNSTHGRQFKGLFQVLRNLAQPMTPP